MYYIERQIKEKIVSTLKRGKSIILFGARQTGKTTLLKKMFPDAIYYNLAVAKERRKFEANPDILAEEIALENFPLVIIDEIQKVPEITDTVQYLIDDNKAKFILTGSSARKMKKDQSKELNLLPGRIVKLQLDPVSITELTKDKLKLEQLLLSGQLPHIILQEDIENQTEDLISYSDTYLEEEIRQEALVRNLSTFSKFLELAAISSGEPINITKLSQEIGISNHTIVSYFNILEDCLIVNRIDPITKSNTRSRLTKSSKYLFFDLGIRRICAKEGISYSSEYLGNLFEQFVGIEILKYLNQNKKISSLHYWRDHNGPEIDYVIRSDNTYIPIEVKFTDNPQEKHIKHLLKFMKEYSCYKFGYVVCRVDRKRLLHDKIIAIPWQGFMQELYNII